MNHYLLNVHIVQDGEVDLNIGYKADIRATSNNVTYRNMETGQLTIAGGTGNIIHGLIGNDTWDPGVISTGAEEAKELTVTGAVLGDFAIASFSLDVTDLVLNAQVTAADTVTCVLANNTGGDINIGSGMLRAKVIKR